MATISIYLWCSATHSVDMEPHPWTPTPPPSAIGKIPKWQYRHNKTLKQQNITTNQELQALIGSKVGEVMYFEYCEQCDCVYANNCKDQKM